MMKSCFPHVHRVLLVGALAMGLAACKPSANDGAVAGAPPAAAQVSFKGVDITGAEYARQLNLPDADGKPRTLADFKGKVLVVFFGYTQCPDVCPTTMAELATVKKQLGPDGERVQGIFVTVDPERDTAAVLKPYVQNFGSDFVALGGTPDQIKEAAREFKVFYAKAPARDEKRYTVDHTAGSFLFDAQGRVRVFERYGSGPEALTHDLKLLLAAG